MSLVIITWIGLYIMVGILMLALEIMSIGWFHGIVRRREAKIYDTDLSLQVLFFNIILWPGAIYWIIRRVVIVSRFCKENPILKEKDAA